MGKSIMFLSVFYVLKRYTNYKNQFVYYSKGFRKMALKEFYSLSKHLIN